MHLVNLQLHDLFQALSDPYRIRMVRLMLRIKTEACLCELSESLNEPEYKLSRHIQILKASGLLNSVRDGKWIYHSLVQNQKYLKFILRAVDIFPDTDRQFEKDFKRFEKRLLMRKAGRCRQSSRVLNEVSRSDEKRRRTAVFSR